MLYVVLVQFLASEANNYVMVFLIGTGKVRHGDNFATSICFLIAFCQAGFETLTSRLAAYSVEVTGTGKPATKLSFSCRIAFAGIQPICFRFIGDHQMT